MCVPVTCAKCGKAGWKGCGQHVEQILGHLPQAQRCQCQPAPPPQKGLLDRILGR